MTDLLAAVSKLPELRAAVATAQANHDAAEARIKAHESHQAMLEEGAKALKEAILDLIVEKGPDLLPGLTSGKALKLRKSKGLDRAIAGALEYIDVNSDAHDRVYYARQGTRMRLDRAQNSLRYAIDDLYQVASGRFESEKVLHHGAGSSDAFEAFADEGVPILNPQTPFHAAHDLYDQMAAKYGSTRFHYYDLATYLTAEHLNHMRYALWPQGLESFLGEKFPEMLAEFRAGYLPLLERYLGPAQQEAA